MMNSPQLSLADLLGEEYVSALAAANAAFGEMTRDEAYALAHEKTDFFPAGMQEKNDALLDTLGTRFCEPFEDTSTGAPTDAFAHAMNIAQAPVSGYGSFRLGSDGFLYLLGKSEHYHASLGHAFPGYRLIDKARRLHVLNPTHNNTRGYITRLCEKRIIQAANGLAPGDEALTAELLASREPKVLNRVINLETGSLAVEAGLKMMLARFYRLQSSFPEPKYSGKTPVFFVMQDNNGGFTANYHGTTIFAQTLRGMWPELYIGEEQSRLYRVVPVRINDIADFRTKLIKYNTGKYKTAGFLHEIVLMNYGAVRLDPEYLREVYALCEHSDTLTLVDEIQSCMWYRGMFLFRLYGLKPDFAVIGKGFSGGEYPASKILCTAATDNLNLFGALVTNGQEELASLAYLITMAFSGANGDEIERCGERLFSGLAELAARNPDKIEKLEGLGHLVGVHFKSVEVAAAFAAEVRGEHIDTSAQLYKENCPPAVLLKPPVIMSEAAADRIVQAFAEALGRVRV